MEIIDWKKHTMKMGNDPAMLAHCPSCRTSVSQTHWSATLPRFLAVAFASRCQRSFRKLDILSVLCDTIRRQSVAINLHGAKIRRQFVAVYDNYITYRDKVN
jgi:hypothetical protein